MQIYAIPVFWYAGSTNISSLTISLRYNSNCKIDTSTTYIRAIILIGDFKELYTNKESFMLLIKDCIILSTNTKTYSLTAMKKYSVYNTCYFCSDSFEFTYNCFGHAIHLSNKSRQTFITNGIMLTRLLPR